MKHLSILKLTLLFSLLISSIIVKAQDPKKSTKESIAIIDFDNSGYDVNKEQIIKYLTSELNSKSDFEVIDQYEIDYLAEKNNLELDGCFSKSCLIEVGDSLEFDNLLFGSIALIDERIHVTLRVLNIESGAYEKTSTLDFVNIKGQEFKMVGITVNHLLGIVNDIELEKLDSETAYDNSINNPDDKVINSSGPRFGLVTYTGDLSRTIRDEYDAFPLMTQFGYQGEMQYLNTGSIQGLVEFIPTVTGIEQGMFIPSLTMLNGIRNSNTGFEFAVGPTFSIIKDYENFTGLALTSGVVIGFGKTYKSGNVNIPLNGFLIPSKRGFRVGVSVGWNAKG